MLGLNNFFLKDISLCLKQLNRKLYIVVQKIDKKSTQNLYWDIFFLFKL